jgi:transposase
MSKSKSDPQGVVPEQEGARRATVGSGTTGGHVGPLSKGQRWSLKRKRDVVLRMFGGESVQVLSRELGVEVYVLEEWRDKALFGLESGLRQRKADPLQKELDAAMKQIGELTMDNELLKEGLRRQQGPFRRRRSRK